VVLPDTDIEGGLQVAERLRACVAATRPVVGGVELQLSISLGVAQLRAADTGATSLVRRADAALYHAKDNGRNRVEAAP